MVSKDKRDEVWKRKQPYLDDKRTLEDLLPICERCEEWCGKEHDFEQCRNMQCFELFLSHEYLKWVYSYSPIK